MNDPLVIFISHKLQSRDRAKAVAQALSAFGRPQIQIHYSGQYPAGVNFKQQIEADLTEASWLILLYEGPEFEWDWCLFEIGFFTAIMPSKKDPKLICLHSPEYHVPTPVQNFNSLPATPENLKNFYRQIYVKDPWRISPTIFDDSKDDVDAKIKGIISAVVATEPPRFIGPSFAIQINVHQLNIVKDGNIPLEAELSGEGGWEEIFGRPIPTKTCSWGDVVRDLESPEPWIYPLATLMWQAYDRQRIQYPSVGVRIKFINEIASEYRVFRLFLQKVYVTGDRAKFAFAGAAVVVPYEPAQNPAETRLYHLYNLAWFFRRRLLERELAKLDFELLNRSPNEMELTKIIREISNDFRTLMADAQVRGMEKEASVLQAVGSAVREEVKTRLFEEWPKLYTELLTQLNVGVSAAQDISATLHKMKPINRFFLKLSIEELKKYLNAKSEQDESGRPE
jgi:hypothetical protein